MFIVLPLAGAVALVGGALVVAHVRRARAAAAHGWLHEVTAAASGVHELLDR